MSKIDNMIAKLCPNGVEYKTLGDVSKINRGVRVTRDMLATDGKIPVYQNALTPLGYFDKSNRKAYSVYLIGAGAAGKIGFSDIEFWAADDCYTFDDLNQIDDKFLYYFLQTQQNYIDTRVRKGSIPRISRDVFEKIKVPVPPLEVQREIVQILDSFTMLTAELTAELTARRKQYEYYRDALLSFGKVSPPLTFGLNNEEVRWMTLGEICKNVCSGGTPNTSHSDYYGGDIPWLRTQEVDWKDIQDTEVKITKKGVENSSAKWIPANCVIVAMYGATAAKVAINKIPLTTNQACCNLEVNPQIASYRYVFHWLCNNYQNLKSLGQGSQSNINAGTVKSFKIPVPSLAMQEKIANVLDNFDAICSDLNIGLPAEIELRKKQYEYYRDRLLTFNTNVNNSIHGGG
ncbi:MAG: restriction endonuclease subunit S [Fibrobacter sp.]|nr:restriction endonuclease subunit S [Fibrobacter sp.]MDY6369184.1 restriction endonuclease subunit S [Fibrobacter sp.]MDY6391048.1 restriction endonuclease subunit S [Fibrobacter sp.]